MTRPSPVAALFDFDEPLLEVKRSRLGIQWLRDMGLLPYSYILKILLANGDRFRIYHIHLYKNPSHR